ncbi:C-type lectin 37Da-like [Drosophila pseudoobscura]|uniref:C-type lectin 37Da-like n=1 Tax=Drosophila pseudoobscura pseudoobscura TaxID=46245 RepID=A0A6I8V587_DROPS|nr:C-type lectin 37Da [Drosophila pseudoobscura]
MRSLSLICLLFGLAWAQTTPSPDGNSTSDIQFSPFVVTDGKYALGTFAKVNWYQAQATCASYGYTLVSITTESDQRALRNFLYTRGSSQLQLLNEPVWTSGTDLANSDNWIWFSNGRTFTYRNFQPGFDYYPSGYRHCLGLYAITSTWVNEDCSEQRYFVCEKRCLFDDVN